MKRFLTCLTLLLVSGFLASFGLSQVPAALVRNGVIFAGGGGGGVIGTANFDMNTGAISNAHYGGVISSVTYNAQGQFTVNLSPSQTDFSVSYSANDPGALGVDMYMNGTPNFHSATSSFQVYILTASVGAFINPNQVTVTITQL